jgi:hypothetical protein
MPSVSIAQRRLMGLAVHSPGLVSKGNAGVLKMSKGQLGEFAGTKEKGLPRYRMEMRKRMLRGKV